MMNFIRRLFQEKPTEVVFINPENAINSIVKLSKERSTLIKEELDYIKFLGDQEQISSLIKRANLNGQSSIWGFEGRRWMESEPQQRHFAEQMWNLGYEVSYRKHNSGGPEADSVSLQIKPRDCVSKGFKLIRSGF